MDHRGRRAMGGRALVLLPLALSLAVVVAQSLAAGTRAPIFDEFGYLEIALVLEREGTFTDIGYPNDDAAPGMRFAPLYPAFLAAIAALDDGVRDTLTCFAARGEACAADGLLPVVVVQAVLGGLAAFFVFLAARDLLRSPVQAWLVLAITLASGLHAHYARHLLTENLAFFGFFLFLAALARGLNRASIANAGLLGLALAIAVLSRPTYLYLVYLMVPVLVLWWRAAGGETWARSLGLAALFGLATIGPLLPWLARNYVTFDDFTLTSGYASYILVQRVAYNFMTWAEWGVAFVFWLPDFGDRLAAALFDPALYHKLTFDDPASYYLQGNGPLMDQTRAAAGCEECHLRYLLHTYLLPNLGKHIAVTVPIALRGMWVGSYLGLVGFILLLPAWRLLARRGLGARFLIVLLPPAFVLGFNAFVSVNVVRYNEPLILVFAVAITVCLVGTLDALRGMGRRLPPEPSRRS